MNKRGTPTPGGGTRWYPSHVSGLLHAQDAVTMLDDGLMTSTDRRQADPAADWCISHGPLLHLLLPRRTEQAPRRRAAGTGCPPMSPIWAPSYTRGTTSLLGAACTKQASNEPRQTVNYEGPTAVMMRQHRPGPGRCPRRQPFPYLSVRHHPSGPTSAAHHACSGLVGSPTCRKKTGENGERERDGEEGGERKECGAAVPRRHVTAQPGRSRLPVPRPGPGPYRLRLVGVTLGCQGSGRCRL